MYGMGLFNLSEEFFSFPHENPLSHQEPGTEPGMSIEYWMPHVYQRR